MPLRGRERAKKLARLARRKTPPGNCLFPRGDPVGQTLSPALVLRGREVVEVQGATLEAAAVGAGQTRTDNLGMSIVDDAEAYVRRLRGRGACMVSSHVH